MMHTVRPPVVWSIAGHDSSGGAGLSADQRAADAMGVHLCPILASVTAQHSQGVKAVFPVPPAQLQAQLQALAEDMPPRAIKTGLIGDVALIQVVAQWVQRLRQRQPDLALVIDPVLGATAGGAAFVNDQVLQAYRDTLLPLATLITPNRAEALRLLGQAGAHHVAPDSLPDVATRLRAMGPSGVVITGGDAPQPQWALDWLDVPQAQGWLASPRVQTPHHHGSGCTFASAAACALALGHGSADAVVLAKMLTTQALASARAAGLGAGPVLASATQPLGPLPYLGLGRELPWQVTHGEDDGAPLFRPFDAPADGLYGILSDSEQLQAAAQAGLRCLQLRHKAVDGVDTQITASARACAKHDAALFINDHWQQALALPEQSGNLRLGLHLGQEDLVALKGAERQTLLSARHRVMLGLSSHSVWELARAAGCGASLIACGPVQATTTKDMPWLPQGADNLGWWIAHSPAPVVAIGGLLTPEDVRRFATEGPAAVCVVRGLGHDAQEMARRVPQLQGAVAEARASQARRDQRLTLPHPVL